MFIWNTKNGTFTVRSMYNSFICGSVLPEKSPIRKSKVPLKIKIFLWYLKRGVTLTKDNLAKRNWQGNVKCFLCSLVETIQHLFFECHFASFVWNTVHITFGIQPPASFAHLFGSWLHGLCPKVKSQIFVGAAALCWALWLNRNDMVFNKATYTYISESGPCYIERKTNHYSRWATEAGRVSSWWSL